MEQHNPVGDVFPGAVPDQTRLVMSRNEIAALCFKAARGAGMSWGLAEEAGRAAAWLAQRGLNGPRNLALHLEVAANRSWLDICPYVQAADWRARSETPLCPIALGATLNDFALLPETPLGSSGIKTGAVSRPVLVLPFLAGIAETTGSDVRVSWPGGDASVGRDGSVHGSVQDLADETQLPLHIQMGQPRKGTAHAVFMAPVSSNTLEQLNVFAMKTTVPPSDRSREDAGSGTTDND